MLLRVARADAWRRSHQLNFAGPELDDIAHQAADDALVAICAKLGQFRGESRFSTWAYKFAVLEVGIKMNRHFWRGQSVSLDETAWEQMPARFGLTSATRSRWNRARARAGAVTRPVITVS